MTLFLDRVQNTTNTTGTGTLTLRPAPLGFQSFSEFGDNNTAAYAIAHPTRNEWEVGIGTVQISGDVVTLERTTVLASTNSDSLVNFSAGNKTVINCLPADFANTVSVIRYGSGAPDNSLGKDGDYYIRTSNYDLYYRASGTYSVIGNIKGAPGTNGSNGAGYAATSTTARTVASSGSFTFTTQAGLAYSPGCRVRAYSTGSGAYIEGVCTAYSGTSLTITADHSSGSGSHSDWNINATGDRGTDGAGTGTVTSLEVTAGEGITITGDSMPITDSGSIEIAISNPTTTALGGVMAINAVTSQWIDSIDSSGVPHLSQPDFTDISGEVDPSQLPAPGPSTYGGVTSLAATTHQFLTSIGTDGIPTKAQPSFSDISGTASAAQLPNPSSTTLGGVRSVAPVANNFVTSISTSGIPSLAQPSASNISGLGTMATQNASAVAITGGSITGLGTPSGSTDAANKAYVDNAVTGLWDFKTATDASSNPNYPAASKGDTYVISVAGKVGGGSGKSVDVGDVILAIADNAGGTEASVGTSWVVLEHNLVGALLAANNLSDLASASTARTNLGLGTAAVKNTGTSGNNVALLDGANTWSAQQTFAAGTITVSAPTTITQTWNDGAVTFTASKINVTDTASAAGSLLQDLQVGGTTKYAVKKDGAVTVGIWQGTAVAVGYGGTGLSSGTSGGVLYFSASNTLASSGALAANAVVLGGGAGQPPITRNLIVDSNSCFYGYGPALNTQGGTTYTLQASDTGKTIVFTSATAVTVTLPNSLNYVCCRILQYGAGQVTLSPASGATLRNASTHTKTRAQYSEVDLFIRDNSGGSAAEYILAGDTAS